VSRRGWDAGAWAVARAAGTLLVIAAVAAGGSPARCRLLRYTVARIVPSTATPIVPPTWRIAVMSAEPDPLRAAERAPSAALSAVGIATPRPNPVTANQMAAKPVLLPTVVPAPTASAAALIANPALTTTFGLTGGAESGAAPARRWRGGRSPWPPNSPSDSPPLIGSMANPAPP